MIKVGTKKKTTITNISCKLMFLLMCKSKKRMVWTKLEKCIIT